MSFQTLSTSIPRISFWICTSILFVCYLFTFYAGLSDRELFIKLLSEDGPLENIATICTLLAAIIFGLSYFKHRQSKPIFFLLFSLLLFLVFMEEISWGQRVFGIATPDSIKYLNAQGEINLHNYTPIYKYVNDVVYLCLDLYFIGFPLLLFIIKDLNRFLLKFKLPIPSPATALLAFLNYLLFNYFFEPILAHRGILGHGKINYGEMLETGIELTLLLFSIECFYRGISWLKFDDSSNY